METLYHTMIREKEENGVFNISQFNDEYIRNNIKNFLPQDYTILLFVETGSRLYGTHSEKSDKDYTCLFMPSMSDRIFHKDFDIINATTGMRYSKNSATDIDIKFVNFFRFVDDLFTGDINSIDILFAIFNKDSVLYKDEKYLKFVESYYYYFLSKEPSSIFRYCLTQAKKYGLKGKDFALIEKIKSDITYIVDFHSIDLKSQIIELYKYFPNNFIENNKGYFFKVGHKTFHSKTKIIDILKHIDLSMQSYGDRTKAAAEAGGIDYKALSHAFRAIWQFEEIANTGKIQFPLVYANEIKKIKYDFCFESLNDALNVLNSEMFRVEQVFLNSELLNNHIDFDTINKIIFDFVLSIENSKEAI